MVSGIALFVVERLVFLFLSVKNANFFNYVQLQDVVMKNFDTQNEMYCTFVSLGEECLGEGGKKWIYLIYI